MIAPHFHQPFKLPKLQTVRRSEYIGHVLHQLVAESGGIPSTPKVGVQAVQVHVGSFILRPRRRAGGWSPTKPRIRKKRQARINENAHLSPDETTTDCLKIFARNDLASSLPIPKLSPCGDAFSSMTL